MAEMATDDSPFARISHAAWRTASASSGMKGRPSYSCPPSAIHTPPSTRRARSAGQSQNGGSEALAGMPSRSAPTRVSRRRCTTAFMKCVVPIITPSIRLVSSVPVACNRTRASRMPAVTSSLVGAFTAAAT